MNPDTVKLPLVVVSPVDVNRLIRELDGLSDFFISANARRSGTYVTPPRASYQLQQLATDNQLNLLEESQRTNLKNQLLQMLKFAPQLHISFAADPPPRVTDAVLGWLRSNIHPQTLLTIGLQPSIAAGCVLRTANKIFDMSLRQYLEDQESYMVKLIAGAASGSR